MTAIARASKLVATAILIGLSIALLIFAVTDWGLSDAEAYWNAAMRLRAGEPLYPAVDDVNGSDVYRYAPWFAFAAVPLTFLPQPVAGALWSLLLVGASGLAILPLVRERQFVLAAFFGSVLLGISAIGNAQPLIIAALVHGVERRSGPVWIGITASLKVVPMFFALVYLGRRQWWRFAASVAVALVLVAPMLAFDLSNYVTDPSDAALLIRWPPLWAGVVIVGSVATVALATTRYGWLAAGSTAVLALPRFFMYDITFLLPGTATPDDRNRQLQPPDPPNRVTRL